MPRRAGGMGGSGHKHHVRKDGSPSRYKQRLAARGLSRTPKMKGLRELGIKGGPQVAAA